MKALDGDCAVCSQAINGNPDPELEHAASLTRLKEYRENALRHPSVTAYQTLISAEKVYRMWKSAITDVKIRVHHCSRHSIAQHLFVCTVYCIIILKLIILYINLVT